jgi:hypothetical protein
VSEACAEPLDTKKSKNRSLCHFPLNSKTILLFRKGHICQAWKVFMLFRVTFNEVT